MPSTFSFEIQTPLGVLHALVQNNLFISVLWGCPKNKIIELEHPLKKRAIQQFDEYFSGQRFSFDLPMNLLGTPFQKTVFIFAQKIPFGTLISYKELAYKIAQPKAFRAVANALARNPLLIIIPCHRIICSNGHKGGYRAGIGYKEWLIHHEIQRSLK